MSTTSPINGLPCPDDGSPNDPPIHFQALIDLLDTRLVPPFTTAAARNAAIPSPSSGQFCAVDGYPMFYRSGQWRGIVTTSATQNTFFATVINSNTETGIATLAIPDPGWPYTIDVSGVILMGAESGTVVNVRVRLDSVSGTVVSQDVARAPEYANNSGILLPIGVFPTGTLTGAHSLVATARRTLGSGTWSLTAVGSTLNGIIRPSYV